MVSYLKSSGASSFGGSPAHAWRPKVKIKGQTLCQEQFVLFGWVSIFTANIDQIIQAGLLVAY